MAFVITGRCRGAKDKSCIEACPVDCIHGTEDDPQLYIDPEVCIDCGACEPVCPVTAIFPDYNVPEQYRDYIRINAEYYKK